MLENFPASLGRHVQIAEPCCHCRAITKRKGVHARVSGVRIAQDMNVGFVDDALGRLLQEVDEIVSNFAMVVPDLIGDGWQ